MNNNNKFKFGYCLEYAVALQDKYRESKPELQADIFLCQKLNVQGEDEFDYETSHAFIQVTIGNQKYGHDVSGIHRLSYFNENCLFTAENESSDFEINGPFDAIDAESYLGSLEEGVMDEARQKVDEVFNNQWNDFKLSQEKIISKVKHKITLG